MGTGSVPLTFRQKTRLVADCLPFGFFVAAALVYGGLLLGGYFLTSTPLVLFFLALIGVLGYQAVQRIRDLAAGVALVAEDTLHHLRGRGARGGHNRRVGDFATLGRLTLTRHAYRNARGGRRYRVVYSPASKIAWALEPLP